MNLANRQVHSQSCSECGRAFTPEFSYQVEHRGHSHSTVDAALEPSFYCSLECVSQSHQKAQQSECNVCKHKFTIEYVSQVINHAGRRFHACNANCRRKLLSTLQGSHLSGVIANGEDQSLNQSSVPRSESEEDASRCRSTTWQRIAGDMAGAPRVLAVFNHKGGTAKTTTSITLAAGLASCDRRVLLVDADAQGNVAVSLDIHADKTLYNVLVMGQDPRDAIVKTRPNLDVLPSNETLAAAELYLAGRQRRDRVLASRLESLRADYDHIIVDCSPSLSLMNQNALVFADALLCPVACDYLSLVGVRQVLRTIKQVNRVLSHPVRLWAVLPTFYDARARVCTDSLATLKQHFGDRCLEPIRVASRVKEAPSLGRTLLEHAGDTTAARDYLRVVARLLSEAEHANLLPLSNVSVAS
jgi:chromosome partitioning protein